ncbi:basement membrane-specific heparan sulfate proteoglycan core protein-like isoform X2 [Alosa sapidissima]|uniref:basement membrane-specific heparan sulfate proteoglycan core protein-like isoform X2 n=1 Tax=Alosa sapidissima TaxID=34773 RepID=UPI001C080ADF|nr:basement membrane-specific heparan sulfate proteoglycan core protein-like isoform X2 [Alosa sapidissima]
MALTALCLLMLFSSVLQYGVMEVRQKAVVILKPNWTKLFRGDTVSLRCHLPGEPSADWEYIWYKNEEELNPYKVWSESNEYKNVGPVEESDGGEYACLGMRKVDSVFSEISDAVILTVSERPKAVILQRPDWPQIFSGETVTFRCDIPGELPSEWRYRWRKDGQKVKPDSAGETNIYRITVADQSHSGKYTCTGLRKSDYKFSLASESVTLTVSERPQAVPILTPKDMEIFSGESVSLRCLIQDGEAVGDWKYSWYKRGYVGYSQISDEQEYGISPATEADSGDYTCRGTRKSDAQHSETSEAIRLTVSGLPKVSISMKPESPIYIGETVTLECVTASRTDWSYTWFKGSPQTEALPSDRESKGGNTLTISGASEQDQDEYWCQGERWNSTTASLMSDPVYLSVSDLPTGSLTAEPPNPVFTGETVTLTCVLESHSDWSYKWYKGSSQNPVSQSDRYHREANTLTIWGVVESDQDHYWCQGEKDTRPTSSHMSTYVYLSVTALPTATLTVQPASPVFSGEIVTFTCAIQYLRDWTYRWYRRNSSDAVSQSERYGRAGNTLTIRGVADLDQDQYWCQGERDTRPTVSQISENVTLNVHEFKPKPRLTSNQSDHIYTGSSLTLTCEMDPSTGTGWTFFWYRDSQNSEPMFQSDVNSYTINFVKVSDEAPYFCCAGRGSPVYYTHYSNATWIQVTERPKAFITLLSNWTRIFSGETISLQCDIHSTTDTDWDYVWYKNGYLNNPVSREKEYRVTLVYGHRGDEYTCIGRRKRELTYSEMSDPHSVSVFERPLALLSVPARTWVREGDSVTLSCEVKSPAAGWRFHWYRADSAARQTLVYSNGGSFTISPVLLQHAGLYTCRAERGDPPYYTKYSKLQPLWVTGLSPPASLVIRPNRTQHFIYKSLSLSCEMQDYPVGWRLRWFTDRGELTECPAAWRSVVGSTCSIVHPHESESGVYWCQSETGLRSNPVNVTFHDADVILESPVHPVMVGDPLTLRCRYRKTPTNTEADIYKDGSPILPTITGEVTIPEVTQSHEGRYRCRHSDSGDSPESWVTVRAKDTRPQKHLALWLVLGLCIGLAVVVVFALLYRYRGLFIHGRLFGRGWQSTHGGSSEEQNRPVDRQGEKSGKVPWQFGASSGPSDVVFTEIELKEMRRKWYKVKAEPAGGRLPKTHSQEVSILI